jgi:galactokinase
LSAPSLAAEFVAHFGTEPQVFRAPSRINIIGEYTDFNDGLVLPAAIALYSWVAIAARPDRRVRTYSSHFNETFETDLDRLPVMRGGHWSDYVVAVLRALQSDGFPLRGADVLVGGDIPLGGGLSSSASLEVAMALASLTVSGLEIDARRLALLCQRAESEFVGVRCGIMDQYAIACSDDGMAMLLDCRPITHQSLVLPPSVRMLAIHSGVPRQLKLAAYNRRREECSTGLDTLQELSPGIRALRDVSMAELEAARPQLSDVVYRRCRHVVTEIERVRLASEAMRSGALQELGGLITASHVSLRDDFEVSCRELDELVENANRCAGVYGARMIGAGFGGCMLALLDAGDSERIVQQVIDSSTTVLGTRPWHYLVEVAGAAREVPVNGTSLSGERR